jgi:uncharacterized membrane protein
MDFPRRELAFQGPAPGFSVLLKRNCSISPAGLARVFALIAIVTLGIGFGFWLAGAWMILPFAGLEIAALAAAFLANGRHATDYERIALQGTRLTVEVGEAERTERHELDARGARVELERDAGGARVRLEAPGGSLEIGRHLDARSRLDLAAELRKRLRN